MQRSDRPNASLLGVLAAGTTAVVGGVLLRCTTSSGLRLLAEKWLPLVLVVAAMGVWLLGSTFNWEDGRGVGAILLALFAVVAATQSLVQPFDGDWLWLQFLVITAIVLLALTLVAIEWSQNGLFVGCIVLASLLAGFVVRVGYTAQRADALRTPISAAIRDKPVLTASAATAAADTDAKAAKAFQGSLATLAATLPTAPGDFRTYGSRIWASLSMTMPDTTAAEGDLALLLALPVPTELTVQAIGLRDAASAAFGAVPSGPTRPPSTKALDAAIADACALAHDARVSVDGCTPPASPGAGLIDASAVLHRLDVAMAFYRAAVSPSDATKAAAAAAAAAAPKRLDTTLAGAAAAGPSAIVSSIDPHNPLRPIPGPLGWLLLGLVALSVLRGLLELNARQMPGPVTINYTGDQSADLRLAVLKNLRTPAATPGSAITQSVTDLSALAGPEVGMVAKVVAAINTVLARDRGYAIDADVVPPSTTGSAPAVTSVLVRVSSAGSKQSLGSASFEHASPETALRSAGYWAAGFLLARSTRIPTWASWNEQTAEALGAATAGSPTLAQLETAARTAPTSGWILHLYGNELELNGREREAVAVYARAVVSHPRYLLARYRLAVSVGMLGRNVAKSWAGVSLAERDSLCLLLTQAFERLGLDTTEVRSLAAPGTTSGGFFQLSEQLLGTIADDTSFLRRTAAALRKSDRDATWLSWWRGRGMSSKDLMWLATSARLVYRSSPSAGDLTAMSKVADRPDSSWQVSYNLACAYARTNTGVAVEWLEHCLLRPGAQELRSQWVQLDPDLEPIASTARFARFCERLDQRRSQ